MSYSTVMYVNVNSFMNYSINLQYIKISANCRQYLTKKKIELNLLFLIIYTKHYYAPKMSLEMDSRTI